VEAQRERRYGVLLTRPSGWIKARCYGRRMRLAKIPTSAGEEWAALEVLERERLMMMR